MPDIMLVFILIMCGVGMCVSSMCTECASKIQIPLRIVYLAIIVCMRLEQRPTAVKKILKILLNPNIDPNRICRTSPSNIKQSSAYVVDLDCLDHPDDVKKDEFGKWNYSGSHVFHYRSERTPEGDLEFERLLSGIQGSNVFQLRRIHCKHPSNPNFQRLLAFVTGMYGEFVSICVYVHVYSTVIAISVGIPVTNKCTMYLNLEF